MDFHYFNIDTFSGAVTDFEKTFPITFCDDNEVPDLLTGDNRERRDENVASVSSTTSNGPKAKKARGKASKQKVIKTDLGELLREGLNAMKENAMLQSLYKNEIDRLLQQPKIGFPKTLQEKFEKTTKRFSSPFITTARDVMWEEFNKIWTDGEITKKLKDTLQISCEFCSWLLLYTQQAVAKRYLCSPTYLNVTAVDLTDGEKQCVAYIAGAVLKNITSKLYQLRMKIVANGEDVATVDKNIKILDACKMNKEELDSASVSQTLIEALDRGGLVYPKPPFIDMLAYVESIFRKHVNAHSKNINANLLLAESLENVSIQNNFLSATEDETADQEQKFEMLKMCLQFYIKVRCYSHARFVIENYRVDTKSGCGKKALRRKLQLSEQEKNNI